MHIQLASQAASGWLAYTTRQPITLKDARIASVSSARLWGASDHLGSHAATTKDHNCPRGRCSPSWYSVHRDWKMVNWSYLDPGYAV
jgi:hypothetical protein